MKNTQGYIIQKNGVIIGKRGYELKPTIDRYGYKAISINGVTSRVHTLVAQEHMNHTLTDNYCIDHIDSDKLNNSLDNLRIITVRKNATIDKVNLSTGLLGVYYREKSSVYEASIRVGGKKTYLGSNTNAEDSQVMYLTALDFIEENNL
tara:strand:- start:8706 stop:9152 length:447 start_codon:yes stop_codon:yes gene_type:complete